ncbi:alkaline phosphatase D family protein [Polaribacter glomeratus]|uniref:Alkaline phosphatase n=1 Tax=Polaribacter glomeratus TaxID=102 RepID=A0A2S7WWZ7_9FLAO|nr:alkaline phosphatase D family protein [Polaribacter glomeratus]PQJ82134.1 alkaline phosphatase [Polaribacter glomeratus]TXD66729.1 alkaline phosphatase family protein [Polaribacter glomeratus]
MKNTTLTVCALLLLSFFSCKTISKKDIAISNDLVDFAIAFGSCNKQYKPNILWQEIKKNKPDLWIWGGDNIYSDTDDMSKMQKDYDLLNKQKGYLELVANLPVMATWDDHDYGFNDSGVEFYKKKEAQKLFLDFFKVDENSPLRKQEGIYTSKDFKTAKGTIKVIILDTRYFRTELLKASEGSKKRYIPNTDPDSSVLGAAQWNWLKNELDTSTADFNIIVSSIQILSSEHGFETWGNFPNDVERLKNSIVKSKAKGVFMLSGDRHISEFSKTTVNNLEYPLIDFTSSGLTHAYATFVSEPNQYRVQNVVSEISFGLLQFNFQSKSVRMQMRGKNNKILQEINQVYP